MICLAELVPSGAVYPAWWGDGSGEKEPRVKPQQPGRQPRPPPRLAYSVQQSMVREDAYVLVVHVFELHFCFV